MTDDVPPRNGPYFFYDGDVNDLSPEERKFLDEINPPRYGPSIRGMIEELERELGTYRRPEPDD